MTVGLSGRLLRGLAGISLHQREQVLGDGHAVSVSERHDTVLRPPVNL